MKGSWGFLKFSTRFNFRSQRKALALLTMRSAEILSSFFSSTLTTNRASDNDNDIVINPVIIYSSFALIANIRNLSVQ